MEHEIVIGNNKFVYDGKVIKIYDVEWPSQEIIMTKEELKELIAMNQIMEELK
jgi:hypothetical protein